MGIAHLCERLGCLPHPGGLFDQDPRHIRRLEKVYEAQGEHDRIEADKVKK
jgi:hypothetical protein